MRTPANKIQENKSVSVSNTSSQKQNTASTFQFVENRPEAIQRRRLQQVLDNSPKPRRQLSYRPWQIIILNNSLQKKANPESGQGKNNTNLPDNLKSGIEDLSGYSMDNVRVHYNSNQPAQLQAHAYAQGTDIHLGQGQCK